MGRYGCHQDHNLILVECYMIRIDEGRHRGMEMGLWWIVHYVMYKMGKESFLTCGCLEQGLYGG